MHNRRPGEIVKADPQGRKKVPFAAHLGQETIRPPSPVTDNRINETGNGDAVQKVANESSAADHCSRCDRRTGVSEGKLKKPECQKRDAGTFVGCGNVFQEKPVIADEAIAVTEHEREAEGPEEQAEQAV